VGHLWGRHTSIGFGIRTGTLLSQLFLCTGERKGRRKGEKEGERLVFLCTGEENRNKGKGERGVHYPKLFTSLFYVKKKKKKEEKKKKKRKTREEGGEYWKSIGNFHGKMSGNP
jgi:hypothetical protein